jgi:hypothetical protein
MQVIEITSLTGQSPYDISICDISLTYCYVVATGVVSVPPTLELPIPVQLEGANQVLVVVTDSIGCEEFLLQSCPGTPTPTPTLTPTPTETRIVFCNCISFENTTSGNLNFSFTQCDGVVFNGSVQSGTTLYYCGRLPSADVGVNIQINDVCIDNVCSITPTPTPTPTQTPTLPIIVGYFQDSCDPLNTFVVSNIPLSYSPLSGVYYIQSSGYIGCATSIPPIISSNLYSYILLNSQPDINTCQILNPCPTLTPTPTPTITPTNTPTMTNTPTISPLDFTLTYSCDGFGNATIQMTSYIGGSGSYESGNGFFSSESAALANTSWIPSTSFAIGVGPGSNITYWMVIKDSLGNLKAKSIFVSCGVPA